MFITFEGGEGCGKSTHSKLLKRYLQSKGRKVILTMEPGGTVLGAALRRILLNGKGRYGKYTELFLFAADRNEHVERVIMPLLKKKNIVICDRYTDSTFAYQSGGRKLPGFLVQYMNRVSSQGITPDLTILMDIDPKEGLARKKRIVKKDRFESLEIAFHGRVRRAYLETARKEPKRIKIVRSKGEVNEVQKEIRRLVDEKLGN